ncbi:MAG: carboxypeptidase-like regulatory domain-containing protein [Planctomycetaceae bacterium]|jgi:hypothetical protein|nr:carboxypeptidase-like regulatory domain-containing protein [Planctomycetaceae bacterium]
MKALTAITLIIVTITIISGCRNPQGRLSVSGTVTLDGEPIADGTISFEPAGEQPIKVRSGTVIRNGKYTVPGTSGLVPGDYTVLLTAQKDTGKFVKMKNDLDGSEYEVREIMNLIPPDKAWQRITVTKTGKQTFDFPIKTK